MQESGIKENPPAETAKRVLIADGLPTDISRDHFCAT